MKLMLKINYSYWLQLNNEDFKDFNVYDHALTQDSIAVSLNGRSS